MTAYTRLIAMLDAAPNANAGDHVLRRLVPERIAKQTSLTRTKVHGTDGSLVDAVAIFYVSQKRTSSFRAVALEDGRTIVLAGEGSQAARAFATALDTLA